MSLEKSLRGRLERTILQARQVAETTARNALQQLGIEEAAPPPYLSLAQGELHRKLRIHGHQLGDATQEASGRQEIVRLAEEAAYQHWHRMLFARFLAENNLLMVPDPDDPVALNLEECQDLAPSYGARNGWELASRFASGMLPQIFRPDSPIFELELPLEHQQELERLLAELPAEVFLATDSLGWVYQFWQAKRKDEINAAETKIGARELPAVTQLFTESYMVHFLLDNSLGAWWATKRLTEDDLQNAKTEDELRRKASLPGMPLEYLRFIQIEDGAWTLAAGTFEGWPENMAEFRMLDPSCGSGHFLIVALMMLVAMRMELEGFNLQEAVHRVLDENIHGLEIDPRCTEIAAFNLALAAWRLTGYRPLPALHIACTGLSIGGTRAQWMEILAGQTNYANLRFYFGQLYDLFSKAPTLGSLINPHRSLEKGFLDDEDMASLHRALSLAMADESRSVSERSEMAVTAQGVAKAAELLAGRYTLVATNVPYLGRGKQDEALKEHLETQYPLGKADLATAFVLRCLEFCAQGGSTALVTPQNWLFLTTYTKLRQMLLEKQSWNVVARLGPKGFQTPMWDFNIQLGIMTAASPAEDHTMAGIDVSAAKEPSEKASMLRGETPVELVLIKQMDQLKNPDARVQFSTTDVQTTMAAYADSYQGIGTSDNAQFLLCYWEIGEVSDDYRYVQVAPERTSLVSGATHILYWESGSGRYYEHAMRLKSEGRLGGWKSGGEAWGKDGVAVSVTGNPALSRYLGTMFDTTMAAIIPKSPGLLTAIETFLRSDGYIRLVRTADQALSLTEHSFLKVPFDLSNWQKAAEEKYPNGLPEPESDDSTQWLFHGRPEESTAPLQVAMARLLGYRWPTELDDEMRLSVRARELVKRCDELLPFADKDGIVCIPPVRGETSAADRLLNLLAAAYGNSWSTDLLGALLKDAGFPGRSLDDWLRDGFFAQHCNLFHQRPFVWHIWDGLRDGFSALVNYHKLDHKNLETLIYTYLGDWITRQKADIATNVGGAEERLAAAEILKKRLELILEGEAPCDIFVRWKPIEMQPIGWEPDLNDGVRLNIRPFLSVPDVRVKDAGVLRDKPKIKWEKDRGKDVASAHWFPLHKGERINDHHLSLHEKREARQKKEVP